MKHSHKANNLRNELDDWFQKRGINSQDVENYWSETYDIDGVVIQNILIDAAQETQTTRQMVDDVITSIELELP